MLGDAKVKYLLFGTGDYYERYKKWFDSSDVAALLDNSLSKQNTFVDGIKVLAPEEGIKLDFDVIVILSFYVKAMKAQLLELGVDEGCIYHFYDLHRLLGRQKASDPIRYYGGARELLLSEDRASKKVLLLSQDLTFGGPSIALFHVAQVLTKNGYKVIYASMLDGVLREKLLSCDIPVIIDENLMVHTMRDIDWIRGFSLIFCNTINFHVFLSDRGSRIPVVWWLHDSSFFYDGVNKEVMQRIDRNGLAVYSVGPVPECAIKDFLPDLSVKPLLYGVADSADRSDISKSEAKCIFLTIGFFEDLKGQDILGEVIKHLPDKISKKVKFIFIGHNQTLYGEKIKGEIESMENVYFTGTVDRETVHKYISESDLLICPSRQDSMPTVAAEAMMHSVPCILSDAAGTAAYIEDGVNGLIFPSEDAQALEEKIVWCVEHQDKLQEMGAASRAVYENFFSMEVFEENISRLIENVLHIKG